MGLKEQLREKLAKVKGESAEEAKPKKVEAVRPKAGGKTLALDIDSVKPNTWNPNSMAPELQARLVAGITRLLDKTGAIPPIVVRPAPGSPGMYEIIDGFHRWKVLKKLNQKTVDSFVLNVDDAQARLLTDTLNYLRGSPDNDKRGRMLAEILMGDESLTVADLALLVPKDAAQLEDLIAASDLDTSVLADLLSRSSTKDATDDDKDEEKWVTLNFSLPLEAATIVERELDRLAESLEGKAKRMRALEFMAVNSSQTPLPDARPSKKSEDKPSKKKKAS